jgi:hypothetical protein
MTDAQSFLARAALGVAAAGAGLVAVSVARFRRGPAGSFDRGAQAALILSRSALFVLVFLVLRIGPRGDVYKYYFFEASAALRGGLPYRDFASSYAPLHPYLDAAALLVWHSPLALILLSVVAEWLLLPVWLRLVRQGFDEDHVRTAVLLYLASPLSLVFVTIDGQDNILVSVLLAVTALLLLRRRPLLAGAGLGGSVALVKFLPLLYAPVFLLAAPRRLRGLLGFCGAVAVGYVPFALLHLPLLYPLLYENSDRTASCLPFLAETIFNLPPQPRLENALLLGGLAVVLAVFVRSLRGATQAVRLRLLVFAPLALTLTLLLLSKKSWPNYLMLTLFPLCLLLRRGASAWLWRLRLAAFSAFSVVCLLAHSYWAGHFHEYPPAVIRLKLQEGEQGTVLLLVLQVALMAGYVWLLAETLRQVHRAAEMARLEPPAAAGG